VSSYKKSLVFCFLLPFFIGCSNKTVEIENNNIKETEKIGFVEVKTKSFELENQYIILALETENQKLYYDARDFYFLLFERTNNYEYFTKYLTMLTQIKDYELVRTQVLKYYVSNIKQEEVILRLYTFALFKLDIQKEAVDNGEKLIKLFPNDINYELLGSVYLDQKNSLKAYEFFEKAFEMNKSVNTFFNLTNILYYNLSKKEEAVNKIEQYILLNGHDFNLSIQLLTFYEKEQKIEKIVPFLKEMYNEYKSNNEIMSLNKTKILLVKYLAKDSVSTAIDFLEQNKEEDEVLLSLYKITNQPQKIYDLLEVLYLKSNNIDYLAQQAIIQFEMSEDKKKVLNEVVMKFDRVLYNSDNHIYQNYLAYILIDYDLNVRRGVSLVKKALEKDPKNIAFLDTLAWGEYKLKNCKEAFNQMKKVIDEVGLDDEEIRTHWQKIKECKK
jgi:tetratricopeptide (TPR) repeat protein